MLRASEAALAANVYYAHFLILGGVGETMQSVRRGVARARHIRHSVIFPYVGMRIYPHTRLHRLAVEQGVVSPDDTLIEPRYWLCPDFDLEQARAEALATGKAWVFPDDEANALMDKLRIERNRKGPLWEYLRKP